MKAVKRHLDSGGDTRLLVCATQGSGGDDESRARFLVSAFDATFVEFDKQSKKRSFQRLLKALRSRQYNLFFLEGSGIGGGAAAILGRRLWGIPYVISSGDAVAPFLAGRHPASKSIFSFYEKSLCSNASGFIGWTPYLAGRALTFGSPRAITIPGWSPHQVDHAVLAQSRRVIRNQFGIPADAVLFGIAGSLSWSSRYNYCYGAELVRAARMASRDVYVLILGDGSGWNKLKQLAGSALGNTIFLPGRVARDQVPHYLAAMDMGSIPQSVDGVGNFRYTTKLSEYKAAGLPFVCNQIPMAYDLDDGSVWRLPGDSPWDAVFLQSLAKLMMSLTQVKITEKLTVESERVSFSREVQIARATAFIRDVLEAEHRSTTRIDSGRSDRKVNVGNVPAQL